MSKPPFDVAVCQACLGEGKCSICNGKRVVSYAQAHKLWGQAFPVGWDGGEIPHIPVVASHKAPKSSKASVRNVSPVVSSHEGVDQHADGGVTINAPIAGIGGNE